MGRNQHDLARTWQEARELAVQLAVHLAVQLAVQLAVKRARPVTKKWGAVRS